MKSTRPYFSSHSLLTSSARSLSQSDPVSLQNEEAGVNLLKHERHECTHSSGLNIFLRSTDLDCMAWGMLGLELWETSVDTLRAGYKASLHGLRDKGLIVRSSKFLHQRLSRCRVQITACRKSLSASQRADSTSAHLLLHPKNPAGRILWNPSHEQC